ncbi:hypothetical protein Tco_1245392 [Tanacetum coccineum]
MSIMLYECGNPVVKMQFRFRVFRYWDGNELYSQTKEKGCCSLQTHLLIAQKDIRGSNSKRKEQASTSGTQTDKAPVYDSDGSAEGPFRFGNDQVAAILGFGDLQLGRNILIPGFVSLRLGAQSVLGWAVLCSDLEVACRRNSVLCRKSRMVVDLLKETGSTTFTPAISMKMASGIPNLLMALCYPKNDREDIGKLGAKGDIVFFIGYSANSRAYRVYNRRTKKIIETINVTFDELLVMAFEQSSLKPRLQSMTSGQIISGLDLTYAPSTITTQQPTERELDLLFEAMYDDYIGGQPSATLRTTPAAQAPPVCQTLMASTTTADTAPTPTNSSSQAINIPNTSQDVDELETQQQHVQNAMLDGNTFVNPFANPSTSATESSSLQYVDPSNMHTFYQPYPHEYLWTKDHPLE